MCVYMCVFRSIQCSFYEVICTSMVRQFRLLYDQLRTPLVPVHLSFLQHFVFSFLSEDQSANGIEAPSPSSSSSSTRWAAAPWWVIVI